MSIQHRPIPVLPDCPRVRPIAEHISRSYPVGKQNYSRAFQGKPFSLTINTTNPIPASIKANLITNINSHNGNQWLKTPFEHNDDHTLVCNITPQYTGLFTFHAEYSLDEGKTWIRDIVADSWVLVDPPQVEGLLMYTINPSVSGKIADWTKDLQRIRDMGFNAVHLLPITLMDLSESPYSANDLFDIDHAFLSQDKDKYTQLADFVEEAKRLDIKLCFDLVFNHVGIASKICKKAPDWIIPDPNQADGFQRARYWCDDKWLVWEDLALINYEHPSEAIRSQIWTYMTEYTFFWANYAAATNGFIRFDNLHSSNPDFVKALADKLFREYPNVGILAEYFTDEKSLIHNVQEWRLNLCLATPWDYKFVPQLRSYLKNIHHLSKHVRYFIPVTSHDSGTPAQEFGSFESTIPRYVAAALMGTGATGIVQGVEYAEPKKIDFIGRKNKKDFPEDAIFAILIGKINYLLSSYKTFRQIDNCEFIDNNHESVIAVFRKSEEESEYGFLVICNFDIFNTHQLEFDLSKLTHHTGNFLYHDLLKEESMILDSNILSIDLEPCNAKIIKIGKV
jgi:hypothetical protein